MQEFKKIHYLGDDQVVIAGGIAICSWSGKDENASLEIDWQELRSDQSTAKLTSPVVEGLPGSQTWDVGRPVIVPDNQGMILILEK